MPWFPDRIRPQVNARTGILVAVAVAVLGSAAIAGWALLMPASRPLTPVEAARFSAWVELAATPAVTESYEAAGGDGRLTVAEAQAVLEVAKAHPPGYGLAGE